MLQPGDPAPDFELPNADMEVMRFNDLRGGKNLVLYFYPKDDTPGCTMEALDFSELSEEFERLNTVVVGVSMDNCVSHGQFRDKYGLTILLLADIEGILCQAYDTWREKEAHGERRKVVVRSTFVIDREGIVRHALYDVKPKGHARAVLDLVREL